MLINPMTIEYNISEINTVAQRVAEHLMGQGCRIILMEGEMGAGKTTLTKAICAAMGADADEVNSPTFSIVNEYDSNEGVIYHFDFYRIKSPREAVDFGLFDYLDSHRWCFMEWSERISDLLPDEVVTVRISIIDDDVRRIEI